MRAAGQAPAGMYVAPAGPIANPSCVIGPGQRCEHALVDQELNRRLYVYEQQIRGRFNAITDTLKVISSLQHERDFVDRAQNLARECLGYELPQVLLEDAWVTGLDLRALQAHCVFRSFKECVDHARTDQAPWRERMRLDADFFLSCGFHTVDVSPCADGRLQGLLPFVFRFAPNDAVYVKAYAGAMFDVESDVSDWSHRELDRLSGGIPGGVDANYLKVAVYHFSSSNSCQQGCAFHASNDKQAVEQALARLNELRDAVENTFGRGAAPAILLIGMDTDTDSLRVHVPDANGDVNAHRFVDSADLYRETLGQSSESARARIDSSVAEAEVAEGWGHGQGGCAPGMRRLILALLEANLSQIEFVIQHHAGRYSVIGHDEALICAGEATNCVQLRNKYYYAHLDTVEEGAADMDVGIKIFTGLNIRHGLAVPVLVHFHYSSRVPGSRARAIQRCRRVKAAIAARYPQLAANGQLYCQMAVSDYHGSERVGLIEDEEADHGH
jgi:carboxysome shell carbonic anhydrase